MENLKVENHHFKNGLACPFYVIMPQREREYITLWACERYNGFPNKYESILLQACPWPCCTLICSSLKGCGFLAMQ